MKKSYKKEREKARDISRVSISDTVTTAAHYLSQSAFFTVLPVRIHGYIFCLYMEFSINVIYFLFFNMQIN